MESVVCNLCGADDADVLFEGCDRLHGLPGRFPLRRCRQCGLIYLSPRPDRDEIQHYYPDSYPSYLLAIDDEPSASVRLNRRYGMAKRLRAISPRVGPPGRALDVGCATGNFLHNLRNCGWQVCGVEPNPRAADYARKRLGLTVFTGGLAAAGYPEGFFDLVSFWDVLEHVHDPRATLEEAARVTKPGGSLALSLPNPESIEARLFGPYWAGWDCPRHLYLFSQPVLAKLLSETGWQMTEVYSFTGRHWVLALSLEFWLKACPQHEGLRHLLLKIGSSFPARVCTLPCFLMLERFNQSSIMSVFAHRNG